MKDKFFDPHLRGVDWAAMRERYGKEAEEADSPEDFAGAVNRMLSELKTSHTRYYVPEDPEYYQLAGIFWSFAEEKFKPFLSNGKPDYAGIGISTATIKDEIFVRAIFDGSPAATAGLRVGDQILDVDGKPFRPMRSFAGKRDQSVKFAFSETLTRAQ